MPQQSMAALIVALATASLQAEPTDPKIEVCIRPVDDSPILDRAQMFASIIYSQVGIQIQWRNSRRCHPGAIEIQLTTNRPPSFLPGALAHAMVYEGTDIEVFVNRLDRVPDRKKHILLGHVFAHEIGHILQRTEEHANKELMKPRWVNEDYVLMQLRPLTFTAATIARIKEGAAQRSAKKVTATASTAQGKTQKERSSARD